MTLAPSLRRAEVDDVSKRLLQTRTHAQAASRGHSLGVISSSAAESTDEILPTALDSLSHRHMLNVRLLSVLIVWKPDQ